MDTALELQRIKKYLEKIPNLDTETVILCLRLRRLTRDILDNIERYFERSGLSRSRFDILRVLFHHPNHVQTPAELACEVGLTRASMTSNLDHLETQGLVRREPHPSDRRSISIFLTEKGHEFMAKELPKQYQQSTLIFSPLSQEERSILLTLYNKVALGTKKALANPPEIADCWSRGKESEKEEQ